MYSKTVSHISAASKMRFPVLLKVTERGLSPIRTDVAVPWTSMQHEGQVRYTLEQINIRSMLPEETYWEDSLPDSSRLGLALRDQGIEALFISAGLYRRTVEKIMGRVTEGAIEPGRRYHTQVAVHKMEGELPHMDAKITVERSPEWLLKISGSYLGRVRPTMTGTMDFLPAMLLDEIGLGGTALAGPPRIDYLKADEVELKRRLAGLYDSNISDVARRGMFFALARAAIAGGKAIMAVHERGDFMTFTKDGATVSDDKARKEISKGFKTEADDASHAAIAGILGEKDHYGIPIIYEEKSDWSRSGIRKGTYISVDEMDGTGRFIKRKPGFMVLTQQVENGQPLVSVNFDPANNSLFWAVAGNGSFIDGERVALAPRQSVALDIARVIVCGRDKERPENANYWKFMLGRFGDRLTAGLATGSRIAGILKGEFDVFVNKGSEELQIWDLGMVLNLREAGGIATRKDGSELDFTQPGITGDIVCSINPGLHKQVLNLLLE